jgi:ribosomal subunit interface protein
MDIVVKGRNVEVPEHFRQHVTEKLTPCARLDSRVFRLDVELSHEKNPRQSAQCQGVEITCMSKGPVIRAEACADSYYAALDAATLKLEARLRKAHEATAMTTSDALHEMELVGHDFYLFIDSHTAQPSVVYRRHGYDYGVIRLSTE